MSTVENFKTILHMGWPWAPQSSNMRKLARQGRLAKVNPAMRPFIWVLAMWLWPFGALLQTRQVRTHIRKTNDPSGFSALSAYAAALYGNIPPWDYFIYQLWEHPEDVRRFLLRHERAGLMHFLNAPAYEKNANPIDNKLALVDFCKRFQIPHPELIWHSGKASYPALEHQPMWIKPIVGSNGVGNKGISKWNEIAQSQTSILVQKRLTNHPDLEDFSNQGLVICRILSGKSKTNNVEIIASTLHIPYGNSHLSHDGLIGKLDPQSGKIQTVRRAALTYQPVDNHPDTQKSFKTLILPDWNQAIEIIKKAHGQLAGYVFIGWDLAFTPEGPVLIEGNSSWNAEQHQEPSPRPTPLGDTVFKDVIETYL